jgi:hypothetical protein
VAFRDRVYTPETAKALLSWRLAVGAAIAIAAVVAGLNPAFASLIGLVVYAVLVYVAMPKGTRQAKIDPFALSEPWRQFVQSTQRSRTNLERTLATVPAGPLRDRLTGIGERLERAVDETWRIARRGDEIDDAVRRIDPVRLRANLQALRGQGGDVGAATASVESQLATADRLKALSASTADQLRVTQARLDELVTRTAEVGVGAQDTESYSHDVDDLVVELEALRQAVAETSQAETGRADTGQAPTGQAG